MSQPHYLIFDVESIADGALVSALRYPNEDLSPLDAVRRYRSELMEQKGSDFIPYTYQIPISVVIAKVERDYSLADLVVLDEPEYRPHEITKKFWQGWQFYKRPTFVTFNGRGFDIPLLEAAAFRYGISIPDWFAPGRDNPRYRFNSQAHLDLHELLTNFGATRFTGGLNLAANLIGKPGKMEVQGEMVQDMFDEGKLAEINNYCKCDVLDTYFVFLRTRVLTGALQIEQEQKLVTKAKQWVETEAETGDAALQLYLENWGDWQNPFAEE